VADLLSEGDRGWLIGELRNLVGVCGAQRFLEAPILEPTPGDFPDAFEPSKRGVRVLLRRILDAAGLPALDVALDTFSQPDEVRELDAHGRAKAWGHEGAAAWFAGIEGGVCHFGVAEERVGEPAVLVGTLCHEVAHAWRSFHQVWIADRDVEERLTDLTTVYLGFGILTTNAAYVYRQSGELTGGEATGSIAVTRWAHSRTGYLPPEAMAFLLAAQVKARRVGWLARRRIARRLETNQAAYFRWAMKQLPPAEELRRELGVARSVAAA
jgi:hypothetical protein